MIERKMKRDGRMRIPFESGIRISEAPKLFYINKSSVRIWLQITAELLCFRYGFVFSHNAILTACAGEMFLSPPFTGK